MNDTILLVGHGSRNEQGNNEIEAFTAQWRERRPDWRIELCFIELAEVLLPQGLDNAANGSTRVIVVPLILNAAGHVKMEIPEHLEAARLRHPAVEFVYARHLGSDEAIFAILKRNLHRCLRQMAMPDPKTTGVILLGRGSSDRVANGEVAKMARWLYEAGDHELVDIAFTGVTHPRLESIVQRQTKLGMMQIAVLPYYLFTGVLVERINQQMQRLQQQYPHTSFACAGYFGFEPEIFALLEQRVLQASGEVPQAAMMECDGCAYREIAHDHGYHDHAH